jgi:hypothetical protein
MRCISNSLLFGYSLAAALSFASVARAQSAPLQDTQIFAGPAGIMPASANNGPTTRGEISIVRERNFTMTAPNMAGSGVMLTAGNTARDGLFAESIYVRSGPVTDNSRDPDTAFSVTFPVGVTVIGVVFADANLTATNATWGLQPTINYTSSAPGVEAPASDTLTVTTNAGMTTVRVRLNFNTSPFTDDFRVLIDYGTAFTPGLSMRVDVATGDDVNVGGVNGGRAGQPTNYTVNVPLTLSCNMDQDMDGVPDCADGTIDTDGDGRPNYLDADDDGDGVPTAQELGAGGYMNPRNSDRVVPAGEGMADAIPDWLDADDDGDGIPTAQELGPGGAAMPRNTDAAPPAGAGMADALPDYLDRDDDGDGIPTAQEALLDTSMGDDFDGDGIPSYRDFDSDADGLFDLVEGVADRNPMNGRPDFLDPNNDSDGDGVPNMVERGGCMGNMPGCVNGDRDTDRDGIPDYLDPDDDGDGIPTAVERNLDPSPNDDFDMDGIPSYRDLDSDGDGDLDSEEAGANPANPANTDRAMDGPDFLDLDSDNDCAPDSARSEDGMARIVVAVNPNANCSVAAPVCDVARGVCVMDMDSDMDGIPNLVERRIGTDPNNPDSDGDGVPDGVEVGPGPLFVPRDTDNDGRIDALDPDDDGDGIPTRNELGPGGYLMPQNSDAMPPMGAGMGDAIPDYLDPDDDNDGIPTAVEAMLDMSMGDDFDGDGIPSYLDFDADGDGLLDINEGVMDRDMNGRPDFLDVADDSDGDGVPNMVERGGCMGNMPGCVNGDRDTDRDGIPDYLDPDDDGDGIPTAVERNLDPSPNDDFDMDGIPSYRDLDSDGDGDLDSEEAGANPRVPANTDRAMDGPDFLDLDSDNDCAPDSAMSEDGMARIVVAMNPSAVCMDPTPVCDTGSGACVPCLANGPGGASVGCLMSTSGLRCLVDMAAPNRNACGCLADEDCPADRTCSLVNSLCEPRMMSMGDAGADAADAADDSAVQTDSGEADSGVVMDSAVADTGVRPDGGIDARMSNDGSSADSGGSTGGLVSGGGACSCRTAAAPSQTNDSRWAIVSLLTVALVMARRRRVGVNATAR